MALRLEQRSFPEKLFDYWWDWLWNSNWGVEFVLLASRLE